VKAVPVFFASLPRSAMEISAVTTVTPSPAVQARAEARRASVPELRYPVELPVSQRKDEIAAAARGAYQTLFGVLPPRLEQGPWKVAPAWRK